MRLLVLLFTALIFTFSSNAFAKTPPEVLTPYKQYRQALKSKDYKTATAHAYDAWQKAEEILGNHKTTGDLAQNYADVGILGDAKNKTLETALERAIELSLFYPESGPEMRLQREVGYGTYLVRERKGGKFKKRFKEVVEFADAKGLSNSTFLAELYTLRSAIAVQRGNHDDTEKYAEKASEIFANASDQYASAHPMMATLFSGYGKEGNKEFVPALMNYQEVMQNLENKLPRDHPYLTKALGRWMLMRNRIKREGLIEEAEAAGMCECWPYDKPRNEAIEPVKRVPPIMPGKAYMSGFSIVEFDLNDDGSTTNIRILESWPPDIFEESSERSVEQWVYSERTQDETDEGRTDLIVPLWYRLTDHNGDLIE